MKKVLLILAVSFLLTFTVIGTSPLISNVVAKPDLCVHNVDTELDYASIQEAISAPQTLDGHTIRVDSGTYHEHVVLNKSICLVGENRETTLIVGDGTGKVFLVSASSVHIINFTVRNAEYGIYLAESDDCKITGNIVDNNDYGIQLHSSNSCKVSRNEVTNTGLFTIRLSNSNNCTVSSNTLTDNDIHGIRINGSPDCVVVDNIISNYRGCGVLLDNSDGSVIKSNWASGDYAGVDLMDSADCIVSGNTVTNNEYGIYLSNCRHCEVTNNMLTGNEYGITFYSGSNSIHHNNFVNNTNQVALHGTPNNVFEKNYWSNYRGIDENEDGIGDTLTPHLDVDNQPLMGMFSDFKATEQHHVTTTSNSTISAFHFDQENNRISFNVTGKDGTVGFCRICIPHALFDGNYTVLVDGLPPLMSKSLPCSNNTHSHLYFTYQHPKKEVLIIPEFPSALILHLVMILTLVAVAVSKKR